MSIGDYPPGAEFDERAPYNEPIHPEIEINVLISVTLSKTVKVRVNDYNITGGEKDDNGNYVLDYDYSDCDLHTAVKEQVFLPQDIIKDWNVDEMECIIDE